MNLSHDELIVVCSFMDCGKSLSNFQMVCKDFNRVGSSDLLWKKHYERRLFNHSQARNWATSSGRSIVMKEDPNENYKLHLREVVELEHYLSVGKYTFLNYQEILTKSVDELGSKLTHMKISVLGELTGVTSLLMRLRDGTLAELPANVRSWPALEAFSHQVTIEGRRFNVELVDISDVSYQRLIPLLMFGSDLCVVTFSRNNFCNSFERVHTKWIPLVQHYMKDSPILILGTKSDLQMHPNYEMVSEKKIETIAKQNNCLSYYEISTHKATNEIMDQFAELCVKSVLLTHKPYYPTSKHRKKCILQ